jgi:hypothetical protein
VGDVNILGAREYSMRIWLDPDRIQALGLTGPEVVNALQLIISVAIYLMKPCHMDNLGKSPANTCTKARPFAGKGCIY